MVIFSPEKRVNGNGQPHIELKYIDTFSFSSQAENDIDNCWLRNISWSKWWRDDKYYTLMVGATSSNSVIVKLISYDNLNNTFDFTYPTICLLGPSRFYVLSLYLHQHRETGMFVIGISQVPGISVFVIGGSSFLSISKSFLQADDPNNTITPIQSSLIKRLFIKKLPQHEPISNLCLLDRDSNRVWVVGLADRIRSFLGMITLDEKDGNNSTFEQATDKDNEGNNKDSRPSSGNGTHTDSLKQLIEKRVNAINNAKSDSMGIINETNTRYQFCCFGVAPHPSGGDYIAILSELITEQQLRYLLPSNSKFQISFLPLIDEKRQVKLHISEDDEKGEGNSRGVTPLVPDPALIIQFLPSIMESSSECIWWKIKALSNTIKSVKKRPLFIKQIINELDLYIKTNIDDVLYIGDPISDLLKNKEDNIIVTDANHENNSLNSIYQDLYTALTNKFYLSKFYDVLRLLIHVKTVALHMQQTLQQAHEKDINTISSINGVEQNKEVPLPFGDISGYEVDIENNTQFILVELCFITLVYFASNQASELVNDVERAMIQSFIVQLEKQKEEQTRAIKSISTDDSDTVPEKRSQFDKTYVSEILDICKKKLAKNLPQSLPATAATVIRFPGDGFYENFDFKAQSHREEIFSEKGYPWSKY